VFKTAEDMKCTVLYLGTVSALESPVVTIYTTRLTFNIPRSAHTVYLYVLCGSENKQLLFHCTTLTDWFVYPRRSVFTARYGLDVEL
jgi:hypothetical protein